MAISSAKKPDARKSSATAKPAAKPAAKTAKPMAKAAITAPKAKPPVADATPELAAEIVLTKVLDEDRKARTVAPQLKKKDLIARVVEVLDGKKKGGVKGWE